MTWTPRTWDHRDQEAKSRFLPGGPTISRIMLSMSMNFMVCRPVSTTCSLRNSSHRILALDEAASFTWMYSRTSFPVVLP